MEFSLNGAKLSLNSGNSENLRNHWGMNWVQYKDLLSYNWLCGWVVESLSLKQEILGSNPANFFFYFYFFCHWIQRIQWKHLEKTPISYSPRKSLMHNITFFFLILQFYCTTDNQFWYFSKILHLNCISLDDWEVTGSNSNLILKECD